MISHAFLDEQSGNQDEKQKNNPPRWKLLDRNGFGKVSGLVHITAANHSNVIGN